MTNDARIRAFFAAAPLPMLALAASYGVYSFNILFVPQWVALVSAAAYELTYVGLAVLHVQNDQRVRARWISLGAVVVSIAYNTLAGLFHREPMLLEAAPLWANVALALLHGAPLAWVAFLVADLLLHRVPDSVPQVQPEVARLRQALAQAEQRVFHAEAQASDALKQLTQVPDDVLLEVSERRISLRGLARALDISPSTLSRRLRDMGDTQ
jgi:hypothetical protein